MTRLSLAAVAFIALATPVLAQSSDDRAACEPDVWRLCTAYIPNVGAITNCLRSQKPRLSPACRMVFDGGNRAAGRRYAGAR